MSKEAVAILLVTLFTPPLSLLLLWTCGLSITGLRLKYGSSEKSNLYNEVMNSPPSCVTAYTYGGYCTVYKVHIGGGQVVSTDLDPTTFASACKVGRANTSKVLETFTEAELSELHHDMMNKFYCHR